MACDDKERDLIVNDIEHNYFVSAGAGSGKTTTLVERIVTMIEKGRDISSIAAITFTKKAANEFYERTVKLLRLLSVKADFNCKELKYSHISKIQTEETMANCKKALANIDLCFFGTIDSFCNTIISSHPMEANVPASLELTEESDMVSLYKIEYQKILSGFYGEDLKKEGMEVKNYIWNLSSVFPSLISRVLYNRQINLEYKTYKSFDVEFDDEIREYNDLVKELYNLDDDLKKLSSAQSRDAWDNLNKAYDAIENGTIDYLTDDFISLKDLAILNVDFEVNNDKYNDLLEADTKSSVCFKKFNEAPIIKAKKNFIYYKVMSFLDHAIPHVSRSLKRMGKLTFFDNLLYVSEMLEDDAKNHNARLIRHIRGDYKYFLLDEFQDTDPLQAKIFFYLSTDNPKANWWECVPEDGSIFIVGDEKQSIYAFRGADIDSFLSIKDMFKESERLNLVSNFRSEKNILKYFNNVFSTPNFFGDTNIKYNLVPLDVKKDNDKSIVVNYMSNKIAPLILHLMKEDSSINYEDFMIITRTTTPHKDIIKQFEEYGIPYIVEGKIDLSENRALKLLFSLIIEKVLPNQENVFSILNLLGYNNQDFYKMKELGYNFDLNLVDGMPPLAYDVLSKLRDIKYNSFTELFDSIIKSFDLFNLSGTKNMEYTYFMLERIRSQIESSKIVTEDELVRSLRDTIITSIDPSEHSYVDRVSMMTNAKHSVSVANLHKVKGLEARVVILYDEKMPDPKPTDITDRKNNKRYLFSLSSDESFGNICETYEYQDLQDLSSLKGEEEIKRLLYVAATRAKEKLFICRDYTKVKEGTMSYWDPLRSYINPKTLEEGMIDSYDLVTFDPVVKDLGTKDELKVINDEIKTKSFDIILPSKEASDYKSKSNLVTAEDDIKDLISDLEVNKLDKDTLGLTSTVKGTMVHKLMEELALRRNVNDIDYNSLINSIVDEFTDARFGNNYKEVNDKYKKVLLNVYNTITNGGYNQNSNYAKKDIYNVIKNSSSVFTEVPFCYKNDNKIYNGVIDLLYQDEYGYHIVDYKTNKESLNLDIHYKKQLDEYIKALKETLGIVVIDAKIYHIDC